MSLVSYSAFPGSNPGDSIFSNGWYELFLLLQEGRVGNDAATISQMINVSYRELLMHKKVMGVSIRIISHAVQTYAGDDD